jgi:adenosine deaminase
MAMPWKLDIIEVVDAVADGVKRGARDYGLHTNLIGIMSRTFGPQSAMHELSEGQCMRTGALIPGSTSRSG